MDIANINSSESLGKWLVDKPLTWSRIVALRIALRALPYSDGATKEWFEFGIMLPLRALFFSWAAEIVPDPLLALAAGNSAAYPMDEFGFNADAQRAASAAAGVAASFQGDGETWVAVHASSVIEDVAPFFDNNLRDSKIFWKQVRFDAETLESEADRQHKPLNIHRARLWFSESPSDWHEMWREMRKELLQIDSNYSVWIDWYERRIRGERAAFDISSDENHIEDKEILRRLAVTTDEDFWGKGYEYINATLKGWLDDARVRSASNLPKAKIDSIGAIRHKLGQQASPQALIAEGKLDAAPNARFDKPQYSENLASLPSELQAFTTVILNSLPRNCERLVRNCFTAFGDELLVRGNRPILSILKAMAASLIAELYVAPEPGSSPDEWQLKDPREWGPGMAEMFAQFFKGHLDLVHHFPLDAEREELIAATPIDEVAASGEALAAPVDEVAGLIVELGKQGFATENIVRIVEAHRLYNRDIAQLPVPDQAIDTVSPKRRHVLQTAGFYLHTYSVLGSTASIYSIPAVQALLPSLSGAIDKLLGFIR